MSSYPKVETPTEMRVRFRISGSVLSSPRSPQALNTSRSGHKPTVRNTAAVIKAHRLDSEFGPLLRRLRKESKYSIAGLAALLGMKQGQLSAVERGADVLTNEGVIKVASILRTDPTPLLAAREKDVKAAFERQWPMVRKPKPHGRSKPKAH